MASRYKVIRSVKHTESAPTDHEPKRVAAVGESVAQSLGAASWKIVSSTDAGLSMLYEERRGAFVRVDHAVAVLGAGTPAGTSAGTPAGTITIESELVTTGWQRAFQMLVFVVTLAVGLGATFLNMWRLDDVSQGTLLAFLAPVFLSALWLPFVHRWALRRVLARRQTRLLASMAQALEVRVDAAPYRDESRMAVAERIRVRAEPEPEPEAEPEMQDDDVPRKERRSSR